MMEEYDKDLYGHCPDAFAALPIPDDVLEEWLKEDLLPLKKEELKQYRENIKAQYLKDRGDNDPWLFLASGNYETGCGHTKSLMITQALPNCEEDFENSENKYVASTTREYRAERKFKEIFGEYDFNFVKFYSRDEFFKIFGDYLPEKLIQLKDEPCYIEFFTRLHYNYS